MEYRLSETAAGSLWFQVIYPVSDTIDFSPDPETTLHLIVSTMDNHDEIGKAIHYLIPPDQRMVTEAVTSICNFSEEEFAEITTLKGLDKWFTNFVTGVGTLTESKNQVSFFVELFEYIQTAYLRIKKNPTAESLRDYTRKYFKELTANHTVVIYVSAESDDTVTDKGMTPGWAFLEYLVDEVVEV